MTRQSHTVLALLAVALALGALNLAHAAGWL